jgi:hypothetical protein
LIQEQGDVRELSQTEVVICWGSHVQSGKKAKAKANAERQVFQQDMKIAKQTKQSD